jgi:outer membrane receptor for ferrienterochelin and colicins
LLLTADKQEKELLRQKNHYYTRNAENVSVPLLLADYVGLPNRSRHMANLKLMYEHPRHHWYITTRNIYRSRWAVFDRDGNGIYNRQDEFGNGFLQINLSAGKEWKNGLRILTGIDNLTNYTDVQHLPNFPGRIFYFSIGYTVNSSKKI